MMSHRGWKSEGRIKSLKFEIKFLKLILCVCDYRTADDGGAEVVNILVCCGTGLKDPSSKVKKTFASLPFQRRALRLSEGFL